MGASKTFYAECNGISSALLCEITASFGDLSKKYCAMWDTGASITCISTSVREDLNLEMVRKTRLKTIHSSSEVSTYEINLEFPGGFRIFGHEVAEVDREAFSYDIVIGMDIISIGDFAVSNFNGKSAFTFRFPSQGLINFNE